MGGGEVPHRRDANPVTSAGELLDLITAVLCAVPRTSHRRADRGGWVEIRRRFRRGRDERVAQSPGSAFLRGPPRGYTPAGGRHHLPEVRHTCGVVRHGSPRTAPTVAPHPLREPPHPSGAGRTRRRTTAIRQAN